MPSTLFFRIFQHLLPDALPWRIWKRSASWKWGDGHVYGETGLKWGFIAAGRFIDRLFDGLTFAFSAARKFVDEVLLDAFPSETRQLSEFETQFGLTPSDDSSDIERRDQLSAYWQAMGGQDPHYIQTVLQTAGFPLFVHEWWEDDVPTARDPRDYTNEPSIGQVQCTPTSLLDVQPQCSAFASQPQCNDFLANEPGYLVNDRLVPEAPPPVPDDPDFWPYFLYIGGATFPDRVEISADRRAALERLILKIRPTQQWLVMLVDYV